MRSALKVQVASIPVQAMSEPRTVSAASNSGSLSSWRSLS